eukprot:m.63419 g.63419  ORF g.63419 m.63419 type:complete len:414 (+) comp11948_c0_seq1:145-1386(+)
MASSSKKAKMERFKRRNVRRKPVERVLTLPLQQNIPECHQFMELLEFERKLDASMTVKSLEIQDALKQPASSTKTLRLFVSHTAELKDVSTMTYKWTLRIQGRTLGRRDAPQVLSHYLKQLVIEFSGGDMADKDRSVDWIKSSASVSADGFSISRVSTLPVTATISLELDHSPRKYKLHSLLASILGIHTATEATVNRKLWEYIKTHNLLSDGRDEVQCNPYLQEAFGCDTFEVGEMSQKIKSALYPPLPVVLRHVIGHNPTPTALDETIVDIDCELLDGFASRRQALMLTEDTHQALQDHDTTITNLLDAISKMKDKREFMEGFAQDPQRFILSCMASQDQDKQIQQVAPGRFGARRQTAAFTQPWAAEAVLKYLQVEADQTREKVHREQLEQQQKLQQQQGASSAAATPKT